MSERRLVAVLCLAAVACGESMTPPDAADGAIELDGGTELDCTDEGATRTASCGNCGMRGEECSGGRWVATSSCLDEGECSAGTVDSEVGPLCVTRERLCSEVCAWGAWNEISEPGSCSPGDERTVGDASCPEGLRAEACSDGCEYVDMGCVSACDTPRRTEPWYAEEICIPAGAFVRGEDSFPPGSPVADVEMSVYWIDRYPVTNARYEACVDEGTCAAPAADGSDADVFGDPEWADAPVAFISFQQAQTFCEWDGGRVLPTEAQWEKAGRGPAPRAPTFTWGDEESCDELYMAQCVLGPTEDPSYSDPYDLVSDLPGTRSYYGVDGLVGMGSHWTREFYSSDFYADGPLTDPDNQTSADIEDGRAIRGAFRRYSSSWQPFQLWRRSVRTEDHSSRDMTFRCVREEP